MDYEVFLLARVREEYLKTGDNTEAVGWGLEHTAKIITSAAAIMVTVFGAFAFASLVPIKSMGFGLAVAVFLDATLVRIVLVPATMRLMGHWNWWLPKWLDRILPNVSLEGVDESRIPATAKPEPAAVPGG
jgi:RND superfamily putative drug exporter